MLRIGRVPGNLGASHYAGLGEVHLKKTFTSMKVFKNFFILLYRNFAEKIDGICVVQNFLEWGVRTALRSDKKFETSKDRDFNAKVH